MERKKEHLVISKTEKKKKKKQTRTAFFVFAARSEPAKSTSESFPILIEFIIPERRYVGERE